MIRHDTVQIEGLVLSPWILDWSPFGPAYLPLEPGLTVLYGLNGSGKSLILQALEQVLTGTVRERARRMGAKLHVHAPDGVFFEPGGTVWIEGAAKALYQEFFPGRVVGLTPYDVSQAVSIEATEVFRGVMDTTISQIMSLNGVSADVSLEWLAREFLGQKRLLISGVGEHEPRWNAEVAAVRAHSHQEVERLMSGADIYAGSNTDEPLWEEMLVLAVAGREASTPDSVGWESIYNLNMEGWRVADLGIPVVGLSGFDPDATTRAVLDRLSGNMGRDLRNRRNPEAEAPGLLRDLAMAAQGRVTGARPWPEGGWVSMEADGSLAKDCGLRFVADLLTARANALYAKLLMDAPTLSLTVGTPTDWMAGRPPAWGAGRDSWTPLVNLSDAERRWATIAVDLALQPRPGGFLLLDEPERALHRAAEKYMASGLSEVAEERGIAVVAATHSPELLDPPDAHVYLVRRVDQGLQDGHRLHPMDDPVKDDLREFGLLPSDLLRRQRGFVLVEGQHDMIVLKALLGPELAELRVELLPMRGASNLPNTLDSRVLYDFTDAHVFVMLDALRSSEIEPIWAEGVRLAKTGATSAAAMHVFDGYKALKIDEATYLATFAARAIELGRASRHTPLAMSAPDILYYLPVEGFVPRAASWDQLRREGERSAGKPQSGTAFKTWLRKAKKADLSDESIRRVCATMDHIPEDFTTNLERIRKTLHDN